MPWLCPSWVKFLILNVVLRVSRRKKPIFFPCGAFLSCVVDEMFIDVPWFRENSPALKNSWLRASHVTKLVFVNRRAQKCKCSTLAPIIGTNKFCKTVNWRKSIEYWQLLLFLNYLIFNPLLPIFPCLYPWKHKKKTFGKAGMDIPWNLAVLLILWSSN